MTDWNRKERRSYYADFEVREIAVITAIIGAALGAGIASVLWMVLR